MKKVTLYEKVLQGLPPEEQKKELLRIKNDMVKILKDHVCKVVFYKVNGEERIMKATLKKQYIDDYFSKNNQKIIKSNKNSSNNSKVELVNIWDIEKNAWRKFNINRVISFDMMRK